MAPKRKKLGRPPGPKNKKLQTHNKNLVKNNSFNVVIMKKEKDISSLDVEYVCNVCNKNFKTGKQLLIHHKRCRAIGYNEMVFSKAAYSCKECPKKFGFKKSFSEHLQKEHSKLPNSVSCDKCNVCCPDKKTLIDHIKNVHSLDVEYLCNVCNKNFKTGKQLLIHHKRCRAIGYNEMVFSKAAYSCKECPKKFRFKKSFSEHLQKEHSKLPNSVSCDKCNVCCPDKKTLIDHIKNVHERDIFSCLHCKRTFVRRSHVLRHMAQSGCDGQGQASFSCEICEAKFSRKDNLMVHIRLQHIIKTAFNCKQCLFATKNFSKLVNHWHKVHAETPDQYQCHHCSKWTSSRAAMTKHLEIHGEKKFACDVCGYSTFTIEVMRRHALTHVAEKPYKCAVCGKSYIQRVQLQRHLDKHTGNLCSICGETFASRARLLIHMREHNGLDKLYCPVSTCIYSTKEFISETSLENHLKVHLDDKPYSCEVCTKSFHSEVNLRRHLDTHTLDRPRRCMYCVSARAYVRGEQLIRHVRKHHPAVFKGHLQHVRSVLGIDNSVERVKKSEIESIVNLLDAESDRILQGYSGSGVLYGGMQDEQSSSSSEPQKKGNFAVMSAEDELTENLKLLLSHLIDEETLDLFGWPNESVDVILEKVIEQCGAKPADREKWTRVQRLRENSKHLFLYVIEDKNIARMLDTHTIDQIVKHILKQVSEDDTKVQVDSLK